LFHGSISQKTVVWISAMTAQLPAHSRRRACEAATLQTKTILHS